MNATDKHRLFVDTDMGVDDAAAVAWLLTQNEYPIEIAGISAVWGNVEVEFVTGNVLALLEALNRQDIPVVLGASKPLQAERTCIGAMMHGPDGMWNACNRRETNHPARDVAELYRRANGATLLTLGPLTNVARVLETDPDALRGFSQIVCLGGARHGGGITAVAETNFWQDPEAASRVLSTDLPLTLLIADAHRMFALTNDDIETILRSTTPPARFLAKPLRAYTALQAKFRSNMHCADVVAAICAVDPSMITTVQSGLVKVVTSDDHLVRGQSVMGFTMGEKITMIESPAAFDPLIRRVMADPSFNFDAAIGSILAREPDNARVVMAVDGARIKSAFLRAFANHAP